MKKWFNDKQNAIYNRREIKNPINNDIRHEKMNKDNNCDSFLLHSKN